MSRADHEIRPTGGRGPRGRTATDRRSPYWRRLDLIHDGRTFLRRRGLDLQGAGGILIHRIDAPDPGRDLHDHPWAFVSIVLRGGYTEEWADTRKACDLSNQAEWRDQQEPRPEGRTWARGATRTWKRWSVHQMPLTLAHRITAVEPNTTTLVLRRRKVRRWGFYLPTHWCDWEAYDYATRRPVSVASNHPEEVMP